MIWDVLLNAFSQSVRWRSGWITDGFPVKQIAERLGVTKHTVFTWDYAKRMLAHHVGCFWKFEKEEMDEWVRAGGPAMEATADQDASAQCGCPNDPMRTNTP